MRFAVGGDIAVDGSPGFDVVVVGAGIAGLYTALNIDERFSCCVLTKENVEISNSWLAQGGIAAAISDEDRPQLHLDDTLVAGAGLCDERAVRTLVEEGPSDVRTLFGMGVPFDLDPEGDLSITREGGHRRSRIVHAGGDATGRETVKALARLVAGRSNVSFMAHSFLADILTGGDMAVQGVLVAAPDGQVRLIRSKNVVIATGGVGQVYRSSTNPAVATGDGLAAAKRCGAKLGGMEFIQFHPTALYSPFQSDRAFLISEAVRGEGGLLKNAEGVRFMEGSHELSELAPRDIVARAIVREMERTAQPYMYVDITSRPRDYLASRFPTIFNECLSRGIDISKDWIPVCPAQHYLIGGVETDLDGASCVSGLYACGEAASTGVHGANRLASNSMLECLVFGRRAARHISGRLITGCAPGSPAAPDAPPRPACPLELKAVRMEIRALMDGGGGVIRTKKGMEEAAVRIGGLMRTLEGCYLPGREYVETLNIATIAQEILTAALARRESVGAHYRED